MPAKAQPLADALVSIAVHPPPYHGSHVRHVDGLVVGTNGLVLTVLNYSWPMERLEVLVPDMGSYDASIERVDPRTGATLLKVEASGLPFAPLEGGASIALGEPVVLLHRDAETGELVVREGYGAPATNEGSRDTLFALLPIGYAGFNGAVVVNRDGELLGMAGVSSWWGTGFAPRGLFPGPEWPAVKTASLGLLLKEDLREDAPFIPAAVSYHGHSRSQNWAELIGSPATRVLLYESAREAMQSLGGPTEVENLGQQDYAILGYKPGTVLEFVYAQPQQLRSSEGELVGEARYVSFWWDRGEGKPDVVLCGAEPGYICGAFLAGNLAELKTAVESAHESGRSGVISDAYSLPGYPGDYPLEWSVAPDKESYRPGEEVTFTVTIVNQSDWPVTAHHLPPAIEVRTRSYPGPWWQQQPGTESRTIAAHETLTLDVPWRKVDSQGNPVPPGDYSVSVHYRTARGGQHGRGGIRFTILPE